MKRILSSFLVLLLISVPFSSLAQEYISIEEMCQQGIPRWTETYETKWRTVDVDVQPTIPDVENMPVLTVTHDFGNWDVSALGKGWINDKADRGFLFNFHIGDPIQDVRTAIAQYKSKKYYEEFIYPPIAFNKSYLPDNDTTLGDVLDYAKNILITMGCEDVSNWLDHPEYINPSYWEDKNGDPIPMSSFYTIELRQYFYGIPIIGHTKDGYNNCSDTTPCLYPGLAIQYKTADSISFSGWIVSETDCLANDIPLCDFTVIQEAIENEITDSHVRHIFEIELGYVLYNTPGYTIPTDGEWTKPVYYAVPAWRVTCLYVNSATKDLTDYDDWAYSVPERAGLEYAKLIINAQTGEVQARQSTKPQNGYYAGFLSWDDVGGKE